MLESPSNQPENVAIVLEGTSLNEESNEMLCGGVIHYNKEELITNIAGDREIKEGIIKKMLENYLDDQFNKKDIPFEDGLGNRIEKHTVYDNYKRIKITSFGITDRKGRSEISIEFTQ